MFRKGFVLILCLFLCAAFFLTWVSRGNLTAPSAFGSKALDAKASSALSFSLGLKQEKTPLIYPCVEGELAIEACHFPPGSSERSEEVWLKLKKQGAGRKIALPARVDLRYGNSLEFSGEKGLFWAELERAGEAKCLVRIFAAIEPNETTMVESYFLRVEEPPYRNASEFLEGSPFRLLAQSRFLGRDLFSSRYGEEGSWYRLEIGPLEKGGVVALQENDWLVFSEGKWQKTEQPSSPNLARILSCREREMILEGWMDGEYLRLMLPVGSSLPFKTKSEGLLSAVRVRSEKQISCMLDKQCLILQAGDWVVKGDLRWKVLRKPDEKNAYLRNQSMGELLVFDGLETKGGQKKVMASLFNGDHSQIASIEMGANSASKRQSGKRDRQ